MDVEPYQEPFDSTTIPDAETIENGIESNAPLNPNRDVEVFDGEEGEEEEAMDDGEATCWCGQPYGGIFMICCDTCDTWYHAICMGLNEDVAANLRKFECKFCKLEARDSDHEESKPKKQKAKKEKAPREPKARPKKERAPKQATPRKARKEEKPRKTSNYNAADYGYGRWEDFPLYQEHVPSQISFALETIRNGADGVKTERPVAVDEVAKDGERCVQCEKKRIRFGSKYCSQDCAFEHASEAVAKDKHDLEKEHGDKVRQNLVLARDHIVNVIQLATADGTSISAPDEDDLALVEALHKKRAELNEMKSQVAEKQSDLDVCLANRMLYRLSDMPDTNTVPPRRTEGEYLDCWSCGKSIQAAQFSAHTCTCFTKKESEMVVGLQASDAPEGAEIIHCDYFDKNSKVYCKKLYASCTKHQFGKKKRADVTDSEVCACPLGGGSYCQLSARACLKHQDWETIKQAALKLEERTLEEKSKGVDFEEQKILRRLFTRRALSEQFEQMLTRDLSGARAEFFAKPVPNVAAVLNTSEAPAEWLQKSFDAPKKKSYYSAGVKAGGSQSVAKYKRQRRNDDLDLEFENYAPVRTQRRHRDVETESEPSEEEAQGSDDDNEEEGDNDEFEAEAKTKSAPAKRKYVRKEPKKEKAARKAKTIQEEEEELEYESAKKQKRSKKKEKLGDEVSALASLSSSASHATPKTSKKHEKKQMVREGSTLVPKSGAAPSATSKKPKLTAKARKEAEKQQQQQQQAQQASGSYAAMQQMYQQAYGANYLNAYYSNMYGAYGGAFPSGYPTGSNPSATPGANASNPAYAYGQYGLHAGALTASGSNPSGLTLSATTTTLAEQNVRASNESGEPNANSANENAPSTAEANAVPSSPAPTNASATAQASPMQNPAMMAYSHPSYAAQYYQMAANQYYQQLSTLQRQAQSQPQTPLTPQQQAQYQQQMQQQQQLYMQQFQQPQALPYPQQQLSHSGALPSQVESLAVLTKEESNGVPNGADK